MSTHAWHVIAGALAAAYLTAAAYIVYLLWKEKS